MALGPRGLMEWASRQGVRGVRLDAMARGMRAREMERSARRDLASLLSRLELRFAGMDLWIPSEHFADPARADRAMGAALATIDLCADIATLTSEGMGRSISIVLPKAADETARSLGAAAERAGVRIADHGEGSEPRAIPGGSIGVGLDPAVLLARSIDPAHEVTRLMGPSGSRLVSARLSDTDGIGRVTPGSGRLDLLAYGAALSVAGTAGGVVLDLRGLREPADALAASIDAWAASGLGSG